MLTWQQFFEGGLNFTNTKLEDPDLKKICDEAYLLEKKGSASLEQMMLDMMKLDPYIGEHFDAHGMSKLNYWINTANLLLMSKSMPSLHTAPLNQPDEKRAGGAFSAGGVAYDSGFYILAGDYDTPLEKGLKHVICCEPLTMAGMPAVLESKLPGVKVLGNDEFAQYFNSKFKTKPSSAPSGDLVQKTLAYLTKNLGINDKAADVSLSRDGKFMFIRNRLNGTSKSVAVTSTEAEIKATAKKVFGIV
jgi:hypothetical protein